MTGETYDSDTMIQARSTGCWDSILFKASERRFIHKQVTSHDCRQQNLVHR